MNCSEITMNQFLDCLLNCKYDSIGGIDNWEEIHNEYIGLRENKSSSYVLSMIKEMAFLKSKIFIIINSVQVLASTYSRELVQELKQCGCKGKFDWSDKISYSSDIKAAISYSKKYISRLDRKKKEFEKYYERHGGKSIQRKDFDIWAITLCRFMGYRIDYNVITVSEFCHMMNSYERYCEIHNAQENNLLKNKVDGR